MTIIPKKKNLSGLRFGRLSVLYEAEPYYTSGGNRKVVWHCKCDCGNEINVKSGELLGNKTVSCGCYNREVTSKRMYEKQKKYNNYDLSGDYGIGYTSHGEEFWFDLEDYEKIKDYCWNIHHTKYVTSHKHGTRKHLALHKLVMDDLENMFDIDHIRTEDKFDNRKSNLRRATRSENNMNKVLQKNNTSGYAGVQWNNKGNVWEVYININKKRTYCGSYNNKKDAIKTRKELENKYYKNFSYDNSQKIACQNEKENI